MSDFFVVSDAPRLVELLSEQGPAASSADLSDRARGVMLGLAAGNLLGLDVEGASYQWRARRTSRPRPGIPMA